MAEVILVTGGARSGKSKEALRRAENFGRRVFIATAEITDEEMRERIKRHKMERSPGWETVVA
ncbi:MAG: adenosylcobinamide kinase / adenosylcobinamide-phosphate guanylyltransferase, partial [Synergistales bacterium]|nr:adenosylcobinamide kinase / adenosylcobinamide-phosphate guanylyltransferase [Synergistales bacterium]